MTVEKKEKRADSKQPTASEAEEKEKKRKVSEMKLSREQAAIIGAFTGYTAGPFEDIHDYAEKKLGRSIFTQEFASQKVAEELREAAREDFRDLCADRDSVAQAVVDARSGNGSRGDAGKRRT